MNAVSKPPIWKEVGEKLKESVSSDEKAVSVQTVHGVEVAQSVASFFKRNAEAGTANVQDGGAFFPYLKIGEANSKNELADGTFSKPGNFYYAPTKEQMGDEITVSIVNISGPFYLKQEPKEPTSDLHKHRKFVQLVGGVIVANNQPFVMIVSGTRLNGLWQYGKDLKRYTKSKTDPIPMFALKTRLSLKMAESAWGMNYIVKYTIATDAAGFPMVLQDEGNLQFLLDLSEDMGKKFIEYEHKFAVDPETLQPVYGGPIEVTQVTEVTPGAKAAMEATNSGEEGLPFE